MLNPAPHQNMTYIYQFAYPGYSIYVSNMDSELTEPLMYWLLQQFFPNQVLACKFFEEAGVGEPYCFVMFTHPCVASAALNILNGRVIFNKKIRVNWACPPSQARQVAVAESENAAIYVGDLPVDIEDKTLLETFNTFGTITCARVVRDTDSGMSKGYGFVVFTKQSDAEEAINRMNGNLLGSRPIKVSWATRNKSANTPAPLAYAEVYSHTPESNTTIYIGGLPTSMDEEACRRFFEPFGQVTNLNFFADKHYAFVTFDTHEGAATAIVRTNGTMVDGSTIKSWWSKDNSTTVMGSGPMMPMQPPYGQPAMPQGMMPGMQPGMPPFY